MELFYSLHLIVLIAFCNFQAAAQETPFKTKEEKELEKLKTLSKSYTISLQFGHFGLFPYAKTGEITSGINISEHNKLFNITGEYYFDENLAAQLSVGLNVIPQEQKIDSISFDPENGLEGIKADGSGNGGAIVPVTLGVKKTFLHGLFRPYVSLNTGLTIIKIGAGTGTGSIYGIEKDIDYESKLIFTYQLGTGFQYRLGKIVRIDIGLDFYGSPKISPSIGGINSYSGLYIFGGLNFILNPR